jgi:hypothetical protein
MHYSLANIGRGDFRHPRSPVEMRWASAIDTNTLARMKSKADVVRDTDSRCHPALQVADRAKKLFDLSVLGVMDQKSGKSARTSTPRNRPASYLYIWAPAKRRARNAASRSNRGRTQMSNIKYQAPKTVAQVVKYQALQAPAHVLRPPSVPSEARCRFKRQISSIRYENREIGGLHHREVVAVRIWRATQCRRPSNACSRGRAFFKSSACECK